MSKPIPQLALNNIYLCSNCNLQDHLVTRTSLYNSTCQNHSYTFDNANYGNNRSTYFPFQGHQLRHYHSANKLHQCYATSIENNYDPSSSLFSYFLPSSSFYKEKMNRNQERHINQHHCHHYYYCCPHNVFDPLNNQNEKENMRPPSTSCSITFCDKPHQYSSNTCDTTSVQEEERLEELDKIQSQGINAYYQRLQHNLSERVGDMSYDLDSPQEKEEKEKGKKRISIHSFIIKVINRKKRLKN
ncbi:hypothetical protein BJ944DRAFT_243922 [Cunninghamella echinulata]|nr:hypothetical protein BJ944DRAFT_243922 [Cunninghamella echinulata]